MVLKSYCKGLVITRGDIAAAYEKWRRALAGHKNAWRVEAEHGSADALIDELAREISQRSLTLRPIHRYERVEPTNGKRRIIGVESVKQQVLDYAVIGALEPFLSAKIGYWQVAGVPGKGQASCRRALRKWVREGGYHVKVDVKQCYPSISHEVVRKIMHKYVRSADILYCVDAILATYDMGGLEIGSYFSLQVANLVLSFAYHHIDGLCKERRGKSVRLISHQIWHMDDGLILGRDKRNLRMAVRSLVRYMRDELGLTIKPWKIARTGEEEPLDLGGFVVRPSRTTMRAGTFIRAKRAFRRFARHHSLRLARRICSYWGLLKHTDSDGFIARNNIYKLLRLARAIVSRAGKAEQWSVPLAQPS